MLDPSLGLGGAKQVRERFARFVPEAVGLEVQFADAVDSEVAKSKRRPRMSCTSWKRQSARRMEVGPDSGARVLLTTWCQRCHEGVADPDAAPESAEVHASRECARAFAARRANIG